MVAGAESGFGIRRARYEFSPRQQCISLHIHHHISGPGLIPAKRLRGACHLGLQQSSVRLHLLRFCVSFNAAADVIAPVFPGCRNLLA